MSAGGKNNRFFLQRTTISLLGEGWRVMVLFSVKSFFRKKHLIQENKYSNTAVSITYLS